MGKVYELQGLRNNMTILETQDGSSQVLTENGNLKLFYKKDGASPKDGIRGRD
jgi:hypothetical protein